MIWFSHFICTHHTFWLSTIFLFSLSLCRPLSLSLHGLCLNSCVALIPNKLLHACFGCCLLFLGCTLHGSSLSPPSPPSLLPPSLSPLLPTIPPWFPPPSPIAVLTPVRNSSSSLSSHNSSETGNVGSLLILADGMVVEHPEDFYRMQVSGSPRRQGQWKRLTLFNPSTRNRRWETDKEPYSIHDLCSASCANIHPESPREEVQRLFNVVGEILCFCGNKMYYWWPFSCALNEYYTVFVWMYEKPTETFNIPIYWREILGWDDV